MDLQLKGKLALVTGSTAGIGLAIATTLAREGARVIINGRSKASVDDVVASLKSSTGGHLHGFAGDLSVASSAEQLVREYPGVQILVNNLGIFRAEAIRRDPGRRLVEILRRQCAQRRKACQARPAFDATCQLGSNHFHLERKRRTDPE
jgi:NAD(P)-dependent dehydrogenase (short-subunit alcohol dehydrogenase family)